MIDLDSLDLRPRFGRPAVTASAELRRILELPRRDIKATVTPAAIAALEARLARAPAKDPRAGWPCVCAEQQRDCPLHLREVQAQLLLEAEATGGALGAVGVGHGKTLPDLLLPMVVPKCHVAVLLVPAQLLPQLLERDIPYYGAHWKIPHVVGRSGVHEIGKGLPKLHLVTYSKLSQQDGTTLLKRINPDLIILDEAQNLADPDAARTVRFLRYFSEAQGIRLIAMSGSLISRSLKQVWHFGPLALGDGSPFPTNKQVVEEWCTALDPAKVIAPVGALSVFADGKKDNEAVRVGFREWFTGTPGVVASRGMEEVEARLVIRPRRPEPPPEIRAALNLARAGERPDGEQFTEQLQVIACARQLGAGFFHRWKYPRGEAPELIEDWFAKRQAWNKAVREALKSPFEHFDSPGLVERAAERACQVPAYRPEPGAEALPVWSAHEWSPWRDVREQVQPEPDPQWLHGFLVDYAAAWAREHVGIVWTEFPELGEAVARRTGLPWFGGGEEASAAIIREKGKRSIVASIRAHGTGKNLQAFHANLVLTPPADGGTWEQVLGRTYRPGQKAEVVTVDVCLHTDEYALGFAKAREEAKFAEQITGMSQRLRFASYEAV